MRLCSVFRLCLLHLVLVVMPGLSLLIAQQNGSFESWVPSGSPPPFNWKYPVGWTTNNATTEFATAGVTPNNYNHSGELAAQIKTLNIFGTYTRSQLALGACMLDYPNYQVKAYTGGEALSMIPDEVSFYYQLTTGDPAEYAVADILIKRGTGSIIPDTLYFASMHLPAVAIYTEVQMPVPDISINMATDSIVILFSSNDTNEIAANILYIDDVAIDFASAIQPVPDTVSAFMVYPNPVNIGGTVTIQSPDGNVNDINVFDANGQRMTCCFEEEIKQGSIRLNTRSFIPGFYFIVAGRYSSPFVVSDLQ